MRSQIGVLALTNKKEERMLAVLLYIIAGLFAWGALTSISKVGQPREPTTPGVVAVSTLLSAGFITVLVIAGTQL